MSLLTLLFTLNLQYNGTGTIIRNATGTTNIQTATGEAAFMAVSALIGASLIFFLLLKHKFTFIYLLFISSMFIVTFVALELHLTSLLNFNQINENILILMSLLLSLIIVYSVFINKNITINTIGLTFFVSITGSLLGIMFTDVQITLILLILSLYDIFTVTKGPLKKIVIKINEIEEKTMKGIISDTSHINSQSKNVMTEKKLNFRRGMFLTLGHVEFGIGDMLFYSAIISNAFTIAFLVYTITLIGVIIGVGFTLYLLTRRELVPGLPIPSLLGLIALWITKLFLI
ncbi:MAG: hypothetical protein ACP5OK_08435 [Thermoprotei archaeon]|jgi:co-chaperonin GroES (HSP10)